MTLTYVNSITEIKEEQLNGFFVAWPNPPSAKVHYKILKESSYFWAAVDSDTLKVVGFINAISDNTLSAYIPLLEVLPAYQDHGIGQKLVELMIDSLDNLYMIDVVCDENVVEFYKPLGFIKGSSMMLRNPEKQAGNTYDRQPVKDLTRRR